MRIINALLVLSSLSFSTTTIAQTYATQAQKFSYTLGHQMAKNLQREGTAFDIEAFIQGARDVMANTELKMSPAEMQQAITEHQNMKAAAHQEMMKQRQALAQTNLEQGKQFLEMNKSKEGVMVTASGLQYKILTPGTGKKPAATDEVEVHYRGTLLNGKQFDSSYDRGQSITFKLDGVIKGWQEVLQLMQEGAKWQVFIPAELAYGASGAGNMIGPNETLIFEIQLIAVK